MKQIKVSYVFGGGGIKGAAHVGVLKVAEEYNIRPAFVAGASVGAINGSMIAMSYTSEDIAAFWNEKSVKKIFQSNYKELIRARFRGRYKLDYLHGLLTELFGDTCIGDTKIPFICVAAKYSTHYPRVNFGQEYRETLLADAVCASASNPGAFVLWEIEDENGENVAYVDGAVYSNTPLDLAYKRRSKRPIICVDLSKLPEEDTPIQQGNILGTLYEVREQHAFKYDLEDHVKKYLGMPLDKFFKKGDPAKRLCVVQPDLSMIGDVEFGKIDWMIEEGERVAREQLEGIVEYWRE